MTFRVHFDDGQKIDVEADNPEEARQIATRKHPRVPVTKIKKVKAS